VALLAIVIVGSTAAAAVPWTAPRRLPGTVGLANPIAATAPDGTDVVVWLEGTGIGTENEVHAKVRVPGSGGRWRDVAIRPRGSFLGGLVLAPTPTGDFWAAYQRDVSGGGQEVFVSRLDPGSRTWSKPVKVFQQPDYEHAGPAIGRAGDGTLVVAAYAPPKEPPPGDPTYRMAIALRKPGGTWKGRFLSPVDQHAVGHDLEVNAAGDIVVSFIQGYALATMTVRAATRGHGPAAEWKIRTLSAAGDSQRAHAAIGEDGTAAVVWSATSTSFDAIRMGTIEADRRLAPWVFRDVVTATPIAIDAYPVVSPRGRDGRPEPGRRAAGAPSCWVHARGPGPAVTQWRHRGARRAAGAPGRQGRDALPAAALSRRSRPAGGSGPGGSGPT
jgi:hypothetical protein